jgi:hypothetical protein
VSHNRRVVPNAALVLVYGGPIMRTTVGPLASSVYWRRRAVVLGAALLAIIVLFVSCSGGDDKTNQHGRAASSSSSTPTPTHSSSPDDEPSFIDSVPGNGPSLPDPGSLQSQPPGGGTSTAGAGATGQPTSGTGTNTNVTAPTDGSCADNEMSTTPILATTTIKRGAPLNISLKIKNIGSRTCSRDVGADPQELYLDQGARKYWSSDDCNPATGHDVRQFAPGSERDYNITWNGHQSSSCANGAASGPNPPTGQFQLRARLGTLVSNPVTLTIVA